MYARVVQFSGATDIDAGIQFIRETVTPLAREQKGYRGLVASADRNAGVLGVLSTWEDQADLAASDSAMAKIRSEGQQIIGGEFTVEAYEEVVFVAKQPPEVGRSLLVRRVSMSPADVDDNLEFFRTTVLPEIEASEGFVGVRQLIDRRTGDGIVGTVWTDTGSMEAAAKAADERRARAAAQRVTFGDQTKREILFVDRP